MADRIPLTMSAALYGDEDAAKEGFEALSQARAFDKWGGTFESAVFSKAGDGTVRVVDTEASSRGRGAKAGAITGAVLGVLFPPSVLVSALAGAAAGAGLGNAAKPIAVGEIKDLADKLESGQAGVIVIAEETYQSRVHELLGRAIKVASQPMAADAGDL